MIEGPGHVPMHLIKENVELQRVSAQRFATLKNSLITLKNLFFDSAVTLAGDNSIEFKGVTYTENRVLIVCTVVTVGRP